MKRHDSSVRKIAQNLVFSLVQIDSLNPYETTVYFYGTQHDVFDAEIRRAISDAGYAIRTTEDTRSINLVNRSVDLYSPGPLGTAVYTLSIGGVSASRAYQISQGKVDPIGSIRITGSPTQSIITNDHVFGKDITGSVIFENTTSSETSGSGDANLFELMQSGYSSILT